mmetsp:Transcript_107024/g.301116  ORF Transcript_107024/g.301116 Transcript_107024/m.301116 type:complete len:393 (+) Transcript_107024:88-1266(+)|eukprot:CAMPEP_0117525498 /NCGR_PEP_ID=MMETSP0784-20121206/35799_1 /TAXON_ID=39447 /ORGANISM="" /LENGTH=392 /DNA_ID=CAMNT_0005321693 /DNA_START=88 /DNA_END=1266 /DNA_ORIENTATION=+
MTPDRAAKPSEESFGLPHVLGLGSALTFCGLVAWALTGGDDGSRIMAPGRRAATATGRPARASSWAFEDHEVPDRADSPSFEDALNNLERAPPKRAGTTKGQRGSSASEPKVTSSKTTAASARGARAKGETARGSKKGTEPVSGDDDVESARAIVDDALKELGLQGTGDPDADLEELKALLAAQADKPKAKAATDRKKSKTSKQEPKAKARADDEADDSNFEFAKLLQEEQQKKNAFDLSDVQREFKNKFGANSKPLLCTGCKLVAASLESELDTHDVKDQENPALMLAAKRRALNAACTNFQYHDVVTEDGEPRFEAATAPLTPDEARKPRAAQRLCTALLEDKRFDMLEHMIQQKIKAADSHDWERWLCAERTRLCKKSEVRGGGAATEL